MSASITAIIVSYNSAESLSACVRGLWANGVTELRVVDNNSRDESVMEARRLGLPVERNNQNIWFAQECNQGAQAARSPLLLFINPDAQLAPHALSRAVAHLADSGVGAVGLHLVDDSEQEEPQAWGDTVTPLNLVRRRFSAQQVPRSARTVGWASAGGLLVRRSVWDTVRGFDNDYFLYWEDVDLGRRINERGWKVVIEPQAHAYHRRGGSKQPTAEKTATYDGSADIYFKKFYPFPVWLMHRLLRRAYRISSPRVR